MKSIILPPVLASLATLALAAVQSPIETPVPKKPTVQGCFSSVGDLTFDSAPDWMSSGKCGHDICMTNGFSVAATTEGSKCYCGSKYPPKADLSDPLMCNVSCTGFGEACGGLGYFTVYNTGIDLVGVQYSGDPPASAPGTSTSQAPGVTVKVTESATADKGATPAGPNTAAIAAGVVVGVVVVGALVGGFFWFMRRRRNQEIEEEHRRNAAINSFVGGKPPSSSGGWSNSDSRLDPVMAQRRQSSGSIADDQDYSRKILRVTNA